MSHSNVEDAYPLSPLQEGLLFHSLEEGGAGLHVSHLACRFTGLDPDAFARAWQALIDRHAVLRTAFAWEGLKRPLQVVGRRVKLPLVLEDWRGLDPEEQERRLEGHMAAERERGISPARAPLLRFALFRLGDDVHQFVYSHHHLILDGWSLTLLLRELFVLYAAFRAGREPGLGEAPPPFRGYVHWLQRQDPAPSEAFWKGLFQGFPGPTVLPLDRARGRLVSEREGSTLEIHLPAQAVTGLRALAASQRLTLNTLVQGAWALLLDRYAGGGEVTFGTVVSGRPAELPGVERMLGMFVNTLPIRVQVPPEEGLVPWLQRLQRLGADLREHEHAPLRQVQRWSGVPAGQPLFETLFLFENYPVEASAAASPLLRMEDVRSDIQTSYPLNLVVEVGPPFALRLKLDARRFAPVTARRLLEEMRILLAEMAVEPARRLADLPMLSEAGRQQVLLEWNDVESDYPRERCVHELFEEVVRRVPGSVAIVSAEERLTYAELNARANRLAHHLRALGIRPEVPVAVCVDRSVEAVVSFLATLKAGGAYVPLDPVYPRDRLAWLLEDSGAPVLITRERFLDMLPAGDRRVVCLERAGEALARCSPAEPAPLAVPDNLVYVIYTSGSTGRPKGVAVVHRGVVRLVRGTGYARFDPGQVFLQFSSLSFDASTFEIWGALLNGAVLAIGPAERLSLDDLGDLLGQHGVTTSFLTTGLFNQMVEAGVEKLRGLHQLLSGGEVMSPARVREVMERLPGTAMIACYGPTESTTFASCHHTRSVEELEPSVPIGRPIANTRLHVLGPALKPVPVGAIGELYIGGDGLARGYLHRPDLTGERFIPDPLGDQPGGRLYRTGDLARHRPDGTIEFHGRADHQIKLRGFRIEPGEIESALLALDGVEDAVVVPRRTEGGELFLVAYVVVSQGGPVEADLRAALCQTLPDYMVPAFFLPLAALPLNANGKVDRAALPEPRRHATPAAAATATLSPLEDVLAEIWAGLLGMEGIGPADDFFELGGHSLLATRLAAQVREVVGVALPLRLVFENPTLAALAAKIEALRRETLGFREPPLRPASRPQRLPLSWSQRRLWFLDQLDPGSAAFNIATAVRLAGPLSVPVLERSLAGVVHRHESLRTRFAAVDGAPEQVIEPTLAVPLPLIDLGGLPEKPREAEALRLARGEALRPFDLSRLPLLRTRLIRLTGSEHRLLLTLHHIVSDGWSMEVLVSEASQAYRALLAGEAPALPPLPVQYADYAIWQREWMRGEPLAAHLAFWTSRLAGVPRLRLPTDRPRPRFPGTRAGRIVRELPADLGRALAALGRRQGATPFMTLLAALKVLLGRHAAQDDVTVGTPIAGRSRGEIEGLIGFFLNTLALRTDLSDDPPFLELLTRVRTRALEAYAYQELPFELLIEELQPERDASRSPLFEVMFNFLRFSQERIELQGLSLELLQPAATTANFDLSLYAAPRGEGVHLALVFRVELWDASTIERLLSQLHNLLAGAAQRPQARLSTLPLLDEAGRAQLARCGNRLGPDNAFVPFAANEVEGTLSARFARQAALRSGHLAVVTRRHRWSYGELERRANGVAHAILERCGAGEGRVALLFEHDAPMLAALLGALAAGKTYVPLDPSYPRERLADMLEDSGAAVLVTQEECRALAADLVAGGLPVLETGVAGPEREDAPEVRISPDMPAYILYTSGSTGRPKGVVQSHRNALHHARAYTNGLHLAAGDCLTLLASYSFDAGVMDMFGALLNGAALFPLDLRREGTAAVPAWLREQAITVYHSTPTVFRHVAAALQEEGGEMPFSLRLVVLGGEAATDRDLELFRRFCPPGCLFVNGLGPTESTLALQFFADHGTGVRGGTVPVGYPVEETAVGLLNLAGEEVDVLAVGEIVIRSRYAALGYWQRPELTEAAFQGEPGTERRYRTGDLARRLLDGSLEFLGRRDFQVKIRGHRIEIGEVEATLARAPGVGEVAVAARQDAAGELRLVAWVVPRSGESVSADELRTFARASLPEVMVPAAFVTLERLPLTSTQKVDRAALPAPDFAHEAQEGSFAAARTPDEEVLAGLWCDILGLERVGIDRSFFDLGGHSLLATQLVSRVRSSFGVDLPLRELFEAPTVTSLAERIAVLRSHGKVLAEPPLVPVPGRENGAPLSFAQERLWLLEQLDPGKTTYNMFFPIRLRGDLHAEVLEACFAELVARHESLRTTFAAEGGIGRQVVNPPVPAALPLIDLGSLPEEVRRSELERLGAVEAVTPFDLAAGPLLRLRLVRFTPDEHVLLLSIHHIVSDGWSMGVLLREVAALYQGRATGRPVSLPELPVQYADFAIWQRRWLAGPVLDRQLAWWREGLAGELPSLDLPTDRPRPAVQTFRGGRLALRVAPELSDRLRALARREGATPFMTLLAATGELLGRQSGQDDLLVGTPIAGRRRIELEGLIGFFLNSLVLRLDLSGEPTFRDLLARVRETTLGAFSHQDLPFESLLARLQPERDLSRTPLFQVLFNMLDFPSREARLPGLALEAMAPPEIPSKFDLTFYGGAAGKAITLDLVYNADLFDERRISDLADQLEALLARAVESPDEPLSRFSLVAERARALLPDPREDLPATWFGAVHELFSAAARSRPHRIAIEDPTAVWTYAELDAASNRLARWLLGQGVRRGDCVAIWAHRSAPLVLAILGTLAAGAAYTVLDPAYPPARLAEMLDLVAPRAWIGLEAGGPLPAVLEAWLEEAGCPRLALPGSDAALASREGFAGDPPTVAVSPDDLACIAFTSGSTGRPRGVLGCHGSLSHFLPWACNRFGLTCEDRFSMLSGLAHDPLQRDLFTPLFLGAAIVVPDPDDIGIPGRLAAWMARTGVTVANLTPAMAQLLTEPLAVEGGQPEVASLRRVQLVGDALTHQDVVRLRRLAPHVVCVNLYGATETQRALGFHEVEEADLEERLGWGRQVLPLGRGMRGCQLLVLGRAGSLTGIGELGEIAVRSPHLARGYLGDAALTADKFRPDPSPGSPGGRIYRTGDLGRYLPDGEVSFAGRTDFQVKVRGFRIELGEIEAHLRRQPGVRDAVVVARERRPGDMALFAYVAAPAAGAPTAEELRALLAARLPGYMVPAAFIRLDALPLNPNGKVDRRALPAPPEERSAVEAPRNPVEEILAGIWSEILGVPGIGPQDSFFALGGHSLLATRAISRIRAAFGVEVPLRELFEAPVLGRFAARVERRLGGPGAAPAPPIVPVPRDRELPLSFAQERLWFLDRLEPGSAAYVLASAVRLKGPLDRRSLAAALAGIVERHESLRTSFAEVDGRPAQVVVPQAGPSLPLIDLGGIPGGDRETELAHLAAESVRQPFDLGRAPLIRTALVRLGQDDHALLAAVHHIVSDGWSMGVLVWEIAALYGALSQGLPPPIAALSVQYADFAMWQRAWLAGEVLAAELAHWRMQLDGVPHFLALPTDRPRPAVQSSRGGSRSLGFGGDLTAAVRELALSQGATPFMVVLAGFSALLHRVSGMSDFVVGTPIAGRNRAEVEGLIGFFANTLALRCDLGGSPGFLDLLARVREVTLTAYAHQDLPFELLVEELAPERSLAHTPLFQVMLTLQNVPRPSLATGNLALVPLEHGSVTAKFDLELVIRETGPGYVASLEHSSDLFDGTTAVRLLEHLRRLLAGALAEPRKPVAALPLLSAAERHQLTAEGNDSETRFDLESSVPQWVERHAERLPGAVAAVEEGRSATYGELARRADLLARRLVREELGQEGVVAILADRGIDFLVAMLGIWKAGGAYLPLDPAHPPSRHARILASSGAVLELVAERYEPLAEASMEALATPLPRRLSLAELCADGADAGLPTLPPRCGRLAYVLYTSGSTGEPKGAMVEHRGMINHLWAKVEALELRAGDGVAQNASQCFDISVWQFLAALVAGGRTEVISDEAARDPRQLLAAVEERGVTILETVPSLLRLLLDDLEERRPGRSPLAGLRWMIPTGEALPPDLCRRWLALHPEVPLLNAYGPTECSDDVTHHPIREAPGAGQALVPIGRPVPNLRLHVLDRELGPAPLGVPGELYVAGTGVGRGYLGDPRRTAEAWIPDPFAVDGAGARLYRTGDLARLRPEGWIEFLGRIDHQIKIRGHRIELGEVEAALAGHAGVREAAALLVDRGGRDPQLAAFVVPRRGAEPDVTSLRRHLRQLLPDAMVPSAFLFLDALPVTANGKVDRRALARLRPEPVPGEGGEESGAPRTPTEEILAGIWEEVLGRGPVGATANFFELGGHSLLATRVVSRVRQVLRVELPVRSLFEAPTVADLALRIDAAQHGLRRAEPPLVRVPRQADLPLSFAQERLWFLDQLDPGAATYNIPIALRLTGDLEEEVLAAALWEVVRRHESLRTTFRGVQGAPVQVISAEADAPLPVIDLTALPEPAREAELRRLARAEARRGFGLAAGPLWRARVVWLAGQARALFLTLHHIISDGWSEGILIRELCALYDAFSRAEPSPLPELAIQAADFAAWQRGWLQGEVLAAQVAAWQERLAGAPQGTGIAPDFQRPAMPGFRGARERTALGAEVREALRQLGRRHGATPFMVVLAAFASLLCRHGDQEELVVGTPVANRTRPELEGMVGFLVNTLALRIATGGASTFGDLLVRVRETCLDAYAHQDIPFEKVVETLQPDRQLGRQPLFQVALVFQNELPAAPRLRDVRLEPLAVDPGTARIDLALTVSDGRSGLSAVLDYDLDLFAPITARRLLGRFESCLRAVAAGPELPLEEVPALTTAERHQALWERNDTAAAAAGELLHEMVEAQAGRAPDAPAVRWHGQDISYAELDRRANRLARRLRRAGLRSDSPVGLWMERSPEQVVGYLAVLKAGGAFVPLDPGHPLERSRRVLETGGIRFLLTGGPVPADLAGAGVHLIRVDEPAEESGERLELDISPEGLAYVIYTSGSTGEPKGVMIPHAGICNTLRSRREQFAVAPGDRILQTIPLTFDPSIWQIFGALVSGACAVLVPPGEDRGLASLVRLVRDERITITDFPPSLLLALLEEEGIRDSALRHVFTGGEAVPRKLLERFRENLPAALHNAYGPTEASIDTTLWTSVPRTDPAVPIGRPIANRAVHVIDRKLRLVPPGVAGELAVGGTGLARGYLGDPAATARSFVPDPFAAVSGARMYRTGDLVRHLPDGLLEFLGRIDQQVKVRGQRVELGEVESVLGRHPEVVQAVVVDRDLPGGQRGLVAYLVTSHGGEIPSLHEHLAERLPGYMVPAAFVVLGALPTSSSGKVDRRALPAPERARQAAHVAPQGPVQEVLAALWSELLGLEEVSARDDFFERGGHSLLATRLVSRLRGAFGIELPLRTLFETPTLAGLAREIEALVRQEGSPASQAPPLAPVPRGGDLPLSFGQQRLWFLDRLRPGDPSYNIPIACLLGGRLDPAALAGALGELERRHEVLRTTFAVVEGEPVQVISPPRSRPLPLVDLSGVPGGPRESELERLRRQEARRPFDLGTGPLLRTLLVRLEADSHALLATLHHIAGDGWSGGILLREVSALYAALAAGERPQLPGLPVQYADYAVWQRRWLAGEVLAAELAWWRAQLAGAPPALELPADRPRLPRRVSNGGAESCALERSFSEGIRTLARRGRATLFMTLLAAFEVLLSRLGGQDDLLVGTPVAGRDRSEVEGLIGFFLNTLVLRTDLSGAPTFLEVLDRVRATALGAFSHQAVPFELLLADLQPERDLTRHPLFQILFNLLNLPEPEVTPSGLTFRALPSPESGAKFDLSLTVLESGRDLRLLLVHDASLFDGARVRHMLEQLEAVLAQAVANPEERIDRYSLVTRSARLVLPDPREILGEPGFRPVACTVFERVAEAPDRPAVIQAGRLWTYAELGRAALSVARSLLARGVGPGEPVAVCGPRCPELIAAIVGIMRIGAVLLPLDRRLPERRRQSMLRQARCRRLVAVGEPRPEDAWMESEPGLEILSVPAGGEVPEAGISEESLPGPSPGAPAYLFFTSGTTGTPKAVLGRQASLGHFMAWQRETFGIGPGDRVAQLIGLSFDAVLRDIYLPLTSGAALCLPDFEDLAPRRVLGWLQASGVTVVHTVPSVAALLADEGRRGVRLSLRWLFLAGEPLNEALVRRWRDAFPGGEIVNFYGATETTLIKLWLQVPEPPFPGIQPLGRPMPQTQVLVVAGDEARACGIGERGEIVVRTPFRSLGYFEEPEATRRRFRPNPFRDDADDLLYFTGDAGRYRLDGTVEILGRLDDQVKVRGVRVEPAEVEAVLAACPAVRESAVLARPDGSGGSRLVAYLTLPAGGEAAASTVRHFLEERLPDAMIPDAMVVLDALPLTPNGKIDRGALPSPESGRSDALPPWIAPRDRIEQHLVRVWEELLPARPIGVRDDFFALGGHSLLAVRLQARIAERLGRDLPVAEIFRARTVEALAALVADGAEPVPPSPLVPLRDRGSLPPFFCVHEIVGSALAYRDLAELLDPDQPFHAFQSLGLETDEAPLEAVEEMAGRYLQELRRVQPEGPYFLGGWSFGGYVALEMARRLLADNEEVALLVLLDTAAPGEGRSAEAKEGEAARVLALFGGEAGLPVDEDELRALPPEAQIERVAELAVGAGLLSPAAAAGYLRRRLAVYQANVRASRRYAPAPYPGRITLLRASEISAALSGAPADGWHRQALGEVEVHTVPGGHRTMLREPHVHDLAELLDSLLRAARSPSPMPLEENLEMGGLAPLA